MAVTTVVGFLDLQRVSISSELEPFLLSMCIDAPESTTSSRSSGLFEAGAGVTLASTRTGQALRRTRLSLRVGQWSKATSDQRRKEHTMQDRKCRTSLVVPGLSSSSGASSSSTSFPQDSLSTCSGPASLRSYKRHREADVIAPQNHKTISKLGQPTSSGKPLARSPGVLGVHR